VRLRLGTTAYLLTSPDDIEHVLLHNHAGYAKTRRLTGARGRRLLGRGILTSTGGEHAGKRRAFAPAFARRSASSSEPAVSRSIDELLERWRPGTEVELAAESMRFARRTILRVLFGPDAPEVDLLDEEVAARQRYLDYHVLSLAPLPELVPRPVVLRHRTAARRLDAAIRAAIRERRASPGDDLLSLLCRAPVEDEAIRDEALVITVTGHETLGAALAWTLYLVATHPAAEQEMLAEEMPGDATERVVLESLRLYPPTWIFVRMALADDTLPSGLAVGRGQKLYLSQWVTHRDPRLFADPEIFDPGRFTPERSLGRPESAYFPFGAGPRLCIGKHVALLELALAAGAVTRGRRLKILPGQRVVPRPGLVLEPRDGIRAAVSAR
jgi:cytochrome P450